MKILILFLILTSFKLVPSEGTSSKKGFFFNSFRVASCSIHVSVYPVSIICLARGGSALWMSILSVRRKICLITKIDTGTVSKTVPVWFCYIVAGWIHGNLIILKGLVAQCLFPFVLYGTFKLWSRLNLRRHFGDHEVEFKWQKCKFPIGWRISLRLNSCFLNSPVDFVLRWPPFVVVNNTFLWNSIR